VLARLRERAQQLPLVSLLVKAGVPSSVAETIGPNYHQLQLAHKP
jgi:hypothetical protein